MYNVETVLIYFYGGAIVRAETIKWMVTVLEFQINYGFINKQLKQSIP